MMVVVVMVVFIDHPLNIAKLLDMARDGDGAFMIETILFLRFLQELHEQGVGDIDERDHKPLLLLALTHQDRQAPLWDIFEVLVLMMVEPVKMKVRHMKVEAHVLLLVSSNPHF